jgi:hypothetical protein
MEVVMKKILKNILKVGLLSICLIVLYGCSANIPESKQGQLNLVWNRKSNYKIIIGSNASESEKTAAKELQKYIKQMSKCKLPIKVDAEELNYSREHVSRTIHKLDSIIYNVDSVTRGEQGALEKYIGDLSRRIDRQPDRVGYGVFVLLSTLLTTGYWLFEYMFDAAGDITSSGYLMIINLLVYLSPFVGDAESIALALVGLSQMNRAIGGDSKKIRAISKRLSSALGDINKWPIEYRESISNEVLKSLSAPLSLGFY